MNESITKDPTLFLRAYQYLLSVPQAEKPELSSS